MSPPVPPQSLMFMGDTPDTFLAKGDSLLDVAWPHLNHPIRSVVDVGCGYGRLAYALDRKGFQGEYLGLDVLERPVEWLRSNFTPAAPRFKFEHLDIKNDRYNGAGTQAASAFRIPEAGTAPDLVLVLSVFTHMYAEDISAYLREIRRVSGAKTLVYATFFLLNSTAKRPYSFDHKIDNNCRYYSKADPLHAIGYEEAWVRNQASISGWQVKAIEYGFQDVVFLSPKM